jgi:hypothetical protein
VFSDQAKEMAAEQPSLELVASAPDLDGAEPFGWQIYKVASPDGGDPLVTGLSYEPVVAKTHAGNYEECWGKPWTENTPMPELSEWECAAAPWFIEASQLDKVWTADGPDDWKHIDIEQLADTEQTRIEPVEVSDIEQDADSISFHVSETGKPVLVRASYFPNWKVEGAEGPYRVAPNFMVVVPTSNDVTLTYGMTKYEWLGRFGTLLGLVGLGLLIAWKGGERYAALREEVSSPEGGEGGDDDTPNDGPNDGPNDDGPDGDDDAYPLAPDVPEPENTPLGPS